MKSTYVQQAGQRVRQLVTAQRARLTATIADDCLPGSNFDVLTFRAWPVSARHWEALGKDAS
jgi:hypothetical protein